MDLEEFLNIEKKYGLLEDNISGFFYWIYVRAEIQWYIRDKIYSYDTDHPQKRKSFFEEFELRLEMIKNALLRGYVPHKKYDVIVLNSPRKVWIDDHYECIYTDDIVKELGERAIVLEKPFEQKHFKPVEIYNVIYSDRIEIKAQIAYYVSKYFRKKQFENKKWEIYERIYAPIKELAEIYKVSIDIDDIINMIMPQLMRYQRKKKCYESIVKKICPKVIIEIDSYDADCMIINEVAKECGLPVIELQHGVTGKNHIGYNYPAGLSIKQFPDYLFVFSDFWKKGIRYPIPKKNIISVGFPYLEKQKKRYPKIEHEKKKVILFLSQGIIGKKLSNIAIEVAKLLDMEKYKIIFKLHPAEYSAWRQLYHDLQRTQEIEVIDNNKRSLYELFALSDVQIGYTSTSIYEGLIYNLDTYIYVQNNNPEMQDLIEMGCARKFSTVQELLNMLCNGDGKTPKITDELWKLDSLGTMKKYINSFICGEDKL